MRFFNLKLVILWLNLIGLGAVVCLQIGDSVLALFDQMRTPSVTASGFLLAALVATRVTWVGRLRDSYEAEQHIENVKEPRERGQPVKFYGGFERLTSALNVLTFMVLLSVILQFTLGFWRTPLAVGACIGASAGSFVIFSYLFYRVRRIEAFWIDRLEQEQEAKQHALG